MQGNLKGLPVTSAPQSSHKTFGCLGAAMVTVGGGILLLCALILLGFLLDQTKTSRDVIGGLIALTILLLFSAAVIAIGIYLVMHGRKEKAAAMSRMTVQQDGFVSEQINRQLSQSQPATVQGETITLWARDQQAAHSLANDQYFLYGALMADTTPEVKQFLDAWGRGGSLSHEVVPNAEKGGYDVKLTLRGANALSPAHQQEQSSESAPQPEPTLGQVTGSRNENVKPKRPAIVVVGAWIIIVVSALMLAATLLTAPRTLAMPLGLALRLFFLFGGLAYGAFRLGLGVAVLRGANWARVTFLIVELLVLNFAVIALRVPRDEVGMMLVNVSPTFAQTVGSLIPGVFYVIVLILLTRRAAVVFFGRPAAAAMNVGKTVLAFVLFCIVYAGAARLAGALGARTLSIATDDWNPVAVLGNVVGEHTGLPLLESSTHIEQRELLRSIDTASGMGQLSELLASPVFEARAAVRAWEPQVALLWIVHFVALPILLRRH